MAPIREQVQTLVNARTRLYGQAFSDRDAEAISSWHSKDIVFNDISMDELLMSKPQFLSMISQTTSMMRHLTIVEDHTTSGTSDPYFTAWEQLIEIEYDVDEPAMGIKKGMKTYIRGCSLIWWQWEGEGEEYFGEDDKEKLRGWKITREHDYMVVLKEGAEAGKEKLFDGQAVGGLRGRKAGE